MDDFVIASALESNGVWIGIGTNDFGKMWVGGDLVYDHAHEGQAVMDREVVPVTLPKGSTPILVKVCNGTLDWGFVFRITDSSGKAVAGLRFDLVPD